MAIRPAGQQVNTFGATQARGKIDIGAWAQQNVNNGTPITSLIPGRGQPNLLENPAGLEKYAVGTFDAGPTRGGRLEAKVYRVPVAGPDDRPQSRFIVAMPSVQKNDVVGYRYVDLGTGPTTPAY